MGLLWASLHVKMFPLVLCGRRRIWKGRPAEEAQQWDGEELKKDLKLWTLREVEQSSLGTRCFLLRKWRGLWSLCGVRECGWSGRS